MKPTNPVLACVLGALLAAASGSALGAEKPVVVDASRTTAEGERILEQSVTVSAPVQDVWTAFTTAEGWRSWAAPLVAVDFRLGGVIESSYSAGARLGEPGNIKNEILAYAPLRMIAFRNVQAPPNTPFDAGTFQRLHTVVLFEAVDATSTRVTIVQPGYRPGEPYDGVYKHFHWGNKWSLEKLAERFTKPSSQ